MMEQKQIFLSKKILLTPDEYESIKDELILLLSIEGASLEDRLIAGSVWLDILADFLIAAAPPLGEEDAKRKEAFETFFSSMKNEQYERPFRIARKPLRGMALKRMFLCLFLSARQDSSKRHSNPGMLLFILHHYIKGYFHWGKISLIPLETGIPVRAFKKIKMDQIDELWSQIILEWCMRFIHTDKWLETENLRKGYLYILLFYAILKRYCIAHTFLRGSSQLEPEDLLKSIQLVEKYYILDPFIEEMNSSNPILKDILEGIFKRKSAPMILVRG